ncbi:hypothetical protein HU200_052589 [Digitaria exilis]|uniref:indole-3-pyruvate monooxygenase n=1 Tax=Digitaria exilis TaxID=1010633 RepID=A0A835AYN8_9POAL|nr:hypothetical protein HU200_052589 [Digitaria exilis]
MQEEQAAATLVILAVAPRSMRSEDLLGCVGPSSSAPGPSGLARLHRRPSLYDLWTNRTYDRLRLSPPKGLLRAASRRLSPATSPTYPTQGDDFLRYLKSYADRSPWSPLFGRTVTRARFDAAAALWRVTAVASSPAAGERRRGEGAEVATRVRVGRGWWWRAVENAEVVVPKVKGKERFAGETFTFQRVQEWGEVQRHEGARRWM